MIKRYRDTEMVWDTNWGIWFLEDNKMPTEKEFFEFDTKELEEIFRDAQVYHVNKEEWAKGKKQLYSFVRKDFKGTNYKDLLKLLSSKRTQEYKFIKETRIESIALGRKGEYTKAYATLEFWYAHLSSSLDLFFDLGVL